MFALDIQAKKLMQAYISPGSSETAGPSFELPGALEPLLIKNFQVRED